MKTAEEKLKDTLLTAKKVYRRSVQRAKLVYKFETSDTKKKAQLLESNLDILEQLFHRLTLHEKIDVFMLGKSICIKARCMKPSYLTTSLKLIDAPYVVELVLPNKLHMRLPVRFDDKPDAFVILSAVNTLFPNIKKVEL